MQCHCGQFTFPLSIAVAIKNLPPTPNDLRPEHISRDHVVISRCPVCDEPVMLVQPSQSLDIISRDGLVIHDIQSEKKSH